MGIWINLSDSYPNDFEPLNQKDSNFQKGISFNIPKFQFRPEMHFEYSYPTVSKFGEANTSESVELPSYNLFIEKFASLERNRIYENSKNWILLPTPRRSKKKIVYHYTNSIGAIGIFTKERFWATSLSFMNDRKEFSLGEKLLDQLLEQALLSSHLHPLQKEFISENVELAKSIRNFSAIFVLCASENGDLLSQWRAYGNDSVGIAAGYSLGIAGNSVGSVVSIDGTVPESPSRINTPRWTKVLYNEYRQLELIKKSLEFCAALTPNPKFPIAASRRREIVDIAVANFIN